jgi:hypothetical protein
MVRCGIRPISRGRRAEADRRVEKEIILGRVTEEGRSPLRSKPNSITCARTTLIRHRIPTVAR